MTKIDYKKELKALYRASDKTPAIVDVPELQYLSLDGSGDPVNSQTMQSGFGALYGAAYGIKFAMKAAAEPFDFVVMPLEMTWWAEDPSAFVEQRRDEWLWSMMILMPPRVTPELLEQVKDQLVKKKDPPDVSGLHIARFPAGKAMQLLHVGPYDGVGETVGQLMAAVAAAGEPTGKYREVYISDPRRTAPERLKTLCRQGFVPAPGDT